ncbi:MULTISPECIES: hypothetical protein [unclassified Microcoleus]|uniref:hypothetical protein n=1 Tax=unclassified Microcoleus TaxID=2642155 RepID=UPI002FD774FE
MLFLSESDAPFEVIGRHKENSLRRSCCNRRIIDPTFYIAPLLFSQQNPYITLTLHRSLEKQPGLRMLLLGQQFYAHLAHQDSVEPGVADKFLL